MVAKAQSPLAPALILLGAYLLFAVEPLTGKLILPRFGGASEVWTACLLFFQVALLVGYLYAHALHRWSGARARLALQCGLLLLSVAALPLLRAPLSPPSEAAHPLLLVLALLGKMIGAPFLLLAATGPLVQSWLAHAGAAVDGSPRASPYRYYALSNFGSMLALLAYPTLIEPALPVRMQVAAWSIGYVVFIGLSMIAAWRWGGGATVPHGRVGGEDGVVPGVRDRLLWFLLSMATSALLLAVTNHVSQNVAAIPLFWVLPLALYLLSFIVCFGRPLWYSRPIWRPLFFIAAFAMIYGAGDDPAFVDLKILLGVHLLGFFICCMACHGELEALRPAARYLTSYYLVLALGGATGGVLVAVIAPMALNGAYDLLIILPATALVVLLAIWPSTRRRWTRLSWASAGCAMLALSAITYYVAAQKYGYLHSSVFLGRDFYGALRVSEDTDASGAPVLRGLSNGNTLHGTEFTAAPLRREPTTYYGRTSGIGVLFQELGNRGPLDVGAIGLGAGTIAAYGRPGDSFRFYEIDPLVETIATRYFWYLKTCPARWSIRLGDGRLSLQSEPSRNFDVLVIDAFSSDSIPVHLLTREAFALYWSHLKPDGVLAVHITNRYLNLAPVVAAAGRADGKAVVQLWNDDDPSSGVAAADWMLLTARPGLFTRAPFQHSLEIVIPKGFRIWTDDYSNLWKSFY